MKRINENRKVTLTLGQLKRLIKESNEATIVQQVDAAPLNNVTELVRKASEAIAEYNQWFTDNDCDNKVWGAASGDVIADLEDAGLDPGELFGLASGLRDSLNDLRDAVENLEPIIKQAGFEHGWDH